MKDVKTHPLEKANHAFTGHKLIRILKTNGQLMEPGFITIMYGEVAFRVQPSYANHDSQFVRMDDIQDIIFVDQEEAHDSGFSR